MAYATLISLENTINNILDHNLSSISLEEKHQIISLHEYVTPLQAFLENFPDKFNSLEGRMREVMNEAEDSLEYLVLEKPEKIYVSSDDDESDDDEFGSEYLVLDSSHDEFGPDPSEGHRRKTRIREMTSEAVDSSHGSSSELKLLFEKVMEEVYLIAGEVKVLEKVMEEIDLMAGEAKEIKLNSSSNITQHVTDSFPPTLRKDAVVGFEDYAKYVKDELCGEQSKRQVISICGMGGIGKTTLARKVYEDPVIMEMFVIRVWVTVSQDYNAERIFSSLLGSLKEFDSVNAPNDKEKVRKILMLRKYLIVMDDMWSTEAWDDVKDAFPDVGNGSRIVLTTRLSTVAHYPDSESKLCEMELMDADQSWSLLKQKVFVDEDYPELEDIGKEIARSCKGLPLAVVVIAGLLSTVAKNRDSWQEIAKKVKSVETDEQEQIKEILSLSYNHLPQYLRPCFLYMASFPEDEEINVSRVTRLWVAEGFLKRRNASQSLEDEAEACVEDLVKRNLVLVTKRTFDGKVKSFSLHDLMRDLSIRKAHESKFLLSLMDKNAEEEYFLEKVKNERRVSVDSCSLEYLSSRRGLTIRTIICSRKQLVKLDFVESVRLLRVFDADPVEVNSLRGYLFDLFHLRHLSIRYKYDIPLSWLNLRNLQTLIIHGKHEVPYGVGITTNILLYWCMPRLRHVYFHGVIDFVDPEGANCSLENLQTISYVSHASCTERILKSIPSLKELKIDCSDGVHCEDAAHLNDLVHLHQLESLEIYAGWKYYKISLPTMLRKLCLRYLRLRWDDMMIVGSLRHLQVLKLKRCICVGSTWETTEGHFPELEFLLMECLNLENWITESSHFPSLKRLLLNYCMQLEMIPYEIGEIPTLKLIEVKGETKKSLLKSAEEIQRDQEEMGNNTLRVVCIDIQRSGYDPDEVLPKFVGDDEDDDGEEDNDDYNVEDDDDYNVDGDD